MAESTRPEEDKEGLSKYIKRMRTVLRRSSTANPITEAPTTGGSTTATAPKPSPAKKSTTPTDKPILEPVMVSHWSEIQQEKARALFAKYGLTLEPGEWKSPSSMSSVQRVAKPIRMRVRRTCHRCQTTYGPDKVCVNCQHVRCKKCPRYPAPKDKGQDESTLKFRTRVPERKGAETKNVLHPKDKHLPLTLPSRTGGQDVIRKPIRQRVRRTCHRCNTAFPYDANECANCRHIRCKKCPRDPPKLHKYPDGYPGDADPPVETPERVWKKPRQRVRYHCHQCSTLFKSGEDTCSSCGHAKGPETIRHPPKRIKPDLNPETVKRVQTRLAEMEIRA